MYAFASILRARKALGYLVLREATTSGNGSVWGCCKMKQRIGRYQLVLSDLKEEEKKSLLDV